MEKELYSMIFKRKSFHIFRDIGNINPDELQSIEEKYNNLTPLINGIQTAIRIVPADQTTCKRGQEYCSRVSPSRASAFRPKARYW